MSVNLLLGNVTLSGLSVNPMPSLCTTSRPETEEGERNTGVSATILSQTFFQNVKE
jgi:hypothetical protein